MPGMTVSELQVRVSADTSDAEHGLSALGSKVGSVGGMIGTAFGGAAIAGVAALAGGFAASTVAAASFESQMSAVKAVSGATGAEMESLQGLALKLGADTSFSASEAAKGIEELVKAGVSIGDVMGGAASSSLSLAAAGAISVGDAAEISANAMNAFGLKGTDVAHVADMIAGAANASAIDVSDFKFSLAAVGAVANTVGATFDDTAVAIALMGQAGIKGSDAGTSLKTMLLNLQPTTKAQISLFRELGITTADGSNRFFDAQGSLRGLGEVAQIMTESLEGMTDAQKLASLEVMFGSDAIRAAAVFTKQGGDGFNSMAEAMSKVTAEAVAAERLNNLKGSVEQLTGSLETAAIQIGLQFTPRLKEMADGATKFVNDATPAMLDFASRVSEGMSDAGAAATDLAGDLARLLGIEVADYGSKWEALGAGISYQAGEAAARVQDLGNRVGELNTRISDRGGWAAFGSTLETLSTEGGRLATELESVGRSLDSLHAALGGTEGEANLVAQAMKNFAGSLKVMMTIGAEVLDVLLSLGRAAIDFAGVTVALGRALGHIATGDLPAARDAIKDGDAAMADLILTGEEFASRTGQRISTVFNTIAGDAEAGSSAMSASVEAGMASAAAATEMGAASMTASMEAGTASMAASTETGMATMAGAVETGMVASVAAVESNAPAAVAGAEAMGIGMASGIETAAPAMAAAAEAGASGAVAAVQGQTGAASGAGQSLGEALGSGIEGGIGAYVGRVAAAAARLVSAAIGAANVEADAHSPSKKTEKLGKDLAQGLEIGLNSSNIGEDMKRKIRDFIAASREYIPTAKEIARVEEEIKTIRYDSQVAALFRAEKMITLDSEVLRLKAAQAVLERDAIGLRHELAAADREVADIERGALADRQRLIEIDGQRARNRLTEIPLEQELAVLTAQRATVQEATARRIADAEKSLGALRERHESDQAVRQDRMAGIDERALRLKRDLAQAEWNILPARQALAAASERVAGIERGTLAERTALIQLDNRHSQIRLQQIDLEKQLLTVQAGSTQAVAIQAQIDALTNQDRYLQLEAERIRTTNDVATMGARIKAEAFADQVRGQEAASQKTRNQSEILQAQQGIFTANEEIIRRTTDKELKSREQLVAALKIEGTATNQRFEAIQKSIDALKAQNAAMAIEAEKIKLSKDIAAVSAQSRREGLSDQVRGYDTLISAINDQIQVLGLERGVFEANESIIKNATENEVAYRNRLIAVFTAEGKPLADRIAAGLALVGQLEKEGKISKELADKIREQASATGAATTATSSLGAASSAAATGLNAGASSMDRMAREAADLARQTAEAASQLRQVGILSDHLGEGPGSWFKQTGPTIFTPHHYAGGGRPSLNVPSIVGERGPELFMPDRAGTILPAQQWGGAGGGGAPQSMRIDFAIGGRVAESIYIEGRQLAIRRGRVPSGSA